ncbi:hypothetical protein HF521_011800 [Silurus meridionalis]|uniref:FIIND domain-containing protein n=1 Tax=Silurus meridionalis TaxID=175797 RepID=A0A8T0AGZ1_SILME|nr:hypothetical protein HF521_011800 [Silurus meridionalis]
MPLKSDPLQTEVKALKEEMTLQEEENTINRQELAETQKRMEKMEEILKDTQEKWTRQRDHNESNRFHCSGAGQFQCKYTNLVFEMKEKAEVLYSIVSWGSVQLDGMGQMQPAGPLYNIDCSEGSMCKLHLPHCEINSDKIQTELAVAHFSDGNVEIIQPLKVTETHVIIDIKNLSLYGLLIKIFFEDKPIKAQVLLFYKDIPGRTKKRKLHMHLLPQNVPVIEHNMYIESSSTCQLVPRKPYRPRCEHYKCQPQTEIFELDSAPTITPHLRLHEPRSQFTPNAENSC